MQAHLTNITETDLTSVSHHVLWGHKSDYTVILLGGFFQSEWLVLKTPNTPKYVFLTTPCLTLLTYMCPKFVTRKSVSLKGELSLQYETNTSLDLVDPKC